MIAKTRGTVPTCKDCINFFVTHDARFPYGCRALGFKSRRSPHLEVQAATGALCLMKAVKSGGKLVS